MIDPEFIRLEIVRCLPIHVHWLIHGNALDFDFSRSRMPLRALTADDLNCCDIDKEWADLLLIGVQDFASGGGASAYLGVHHITGKIHGLDVEHESSPIFLWNSSANHFIRSIIETNNILSSTSATAELLPSVLKEIDPTAFPNSEWRSFSRYVA